MSPLTFKLVVVSCKYLLYLNCFSHADENDYTPLSGEIVTFPADPDLPLGSTACQTVSIIGDDIREENETFIVIISPQNDMDNVIGMENMTITIQDDGDGKFKLDANDKLQVTSIIDKSCEALHSKSV